MIEDYNKLREMKLGSAINNLTWGLIALFLAFVVLLLSYEALFGIIAFIAVIIYVLLEIRERRKIIR